MPPTSADDADVTSQALTTLEPDAAPAADDADGPVDPLADASAEVVEEPASQPYDGEPDPVAAAAVDLAREAAQEIAEAGTVGEHLGVHAEAEGIVTHAFTCLAKGYRGWYWAITVVVVPGSEGPTVSDTVLLPGGDAVMSPTWVPWSDRLAPGDLRPADVLPYRADDPYLEQGYAATGEDDETDEVALWELGLGRARVISALGRAAASERWYTGDRGPTAEEALHASAACSTCGYFLPMAGALRQVFGVCANEWSPSDGRVVSVDHGCGAHSETDVEPVEPIALPEPILDETGIDAFVVPPREAEPEPGSEAPADAVADAEPAAEAVPDAEPAADAEAPEAAEPTADAVADAEPAAEAVADAEPAAEAVADAEPAAEAPGDAVADAPAGDDTPAS